MAHSTSITNLLGLVGVSVTDSNCVLTADRLVYLATLLLQQRPTDPQTMCFLGGSLSVLANNTDTPRQMVPLYSELGDEPFLVIVGRGGMLALLAAEETGYYRTRIFTDPDTVDRVVLVLSQFGQYAYSLDTVADRVAQRGFVAQIITALLDDQMLRNVNLESLLPADQRWLTLAGILSTQAHSPSCLALPAVRQLLQESGCAHVMVGQLDATQQRLWIIASEGRVAPESLSVQKGILATVLHSRQPASTAPMAYVNGRYAAENGDWVGGNALTVLPMIHHGRVWGMLLAASERPLTGVARANLNGLGVLLATYLDTGMLAISGEPSVEAPPIEPTMMIEPPDAMPQVLVPAPAESLASSAPRRLPNALITSSMELLEHLSDGVLLTDTRGIIVALNGAAARRTGLAEQVVGTPLVESSAWVLASLLSDAVMGDLKGAREVEVLPGQPTRIEVLEMGPELWAFVFHGVEAKLPELALPPAGPPLSEAERTEQFLTNFSNIVRAPLQEMRELITQVPGSGQLNDDQSRLLGQVIKLNNELSMLVNDLLHLGQLRLQGHEGTMPMRLDLLIEATIGTYYAEYERRGQQVTTNIPPNMPRVLGDEEGLGRVVAVLLDNAIKYSPSGAIISVTMGQRGGDIVVEVQDTGVGLPPNELALVFDPFYRAPSTHQLGIAGRGLGLTIAKAVVEQHGGQMWATGEAGRGCTFAFQVPCEAGGGPPYR